MFRILTPLLVSLLFASKAWAGEGTDRLQAFLDNVRTLEADFSQTLIDQRGRAVQSSSGSFMLNRPGLFRWDYRKPYEQEIVADGKRIWVYDSDLEQVTVKDQDEALGSSPAALLAGTEAVQQRFTIKELPEAEGLFWVELTPKQADGGFEQLRLGFGDQGLASMEMFDSLGQQTLFTFRNMIPNRPLKADLFRFQAPPGTDVIGE